MSESANYMNILPEELHQTIYMKIFDSCLCEMINLHNLSEQKLNIQATENCCVCNSGRWCDDCLGEYDMFD